MSDPSTFWLTATNIGLGLVVVICCGAVAFGMMQELAARRRKRAEMNALDRELAGLTAGFQDGHAFHIPGLGVTMADGGEQLGKKDER